MHVSLNISDSDREENNSRMLDSDGQREYDFTLNIGTSNRTNKARGLCEQLSIPSTHCSVYAKFSFGTQVEDCFYYTELTSINMMLG